MKRIPNAIVAVVMAACVTAAAVYSAPATAAGMSTHALMAEYARRYLPDGHPLKSVLTAHRPALLAGALYPDGGYATGAAFPGDRDVAEHAHWEYFVNPLIQILHDRGCITGAELEIPVVGGTLDYVTTTSTGLAPLAEVRIDDSCGALIAYAMGIAAHGLGDEVWDALFEPMVRQRGEEAESSPAYTADVFPPGADPSVGDVLRAAMGDAPFEALRDAFAPASLNSIEYAMDVIAIREQQLWADVPYLTFPPADVLAEAYAASGREVDASREAIERAALATRTLVLAERLGAAAEYDRVRQQMPWASGHYFTESGGVLHVGKMIAGYYLHLWDKLQDGVVNARGPQVVGVHPDNGEGGVPVVYAAERFVRVFISASVARESVTTPGALVLFDGDGNIVDASLSNFGPLYQGEGTHGIGMELTGDLRPDHEYTAIITPQATDERGMALIHPLVWTFRTAPAATR